MHALTACLSGHAAAVLRVRPVTQASQLNFPLQRYVAEGLVAVQQLGGAAAAAPAGAAEASAPAVDVSLLCAAGDPDAPPAEEAAAAGAEEAFM
jgi:hypothetical protein